MCDLKFFLIVFNAFASCKIWLFLENKLQKFTLILSTRKKHWALVACALYKMLESDVKLIPNITIWTNYIVNMYGNDSDNMKPALPLHFKTSISSCKNYFLFSLRTFSIRGWGGVLNYLNQWIKPFAAFLCLSIRSVRNPTRRTQ